MIEMSMDRPLSVLELTVLGILLKRGPCVANTVVNEFAGSQTFAYRSGAGSIYPLLKRLAAADLLTVKGRKYALSESGVGALKAWVHPPFDITDFSTNLDSLRSRAFFLKLLSPTELPQFFASALTGLEALLARCQTTLEAQRQSGDLFGELAQLGAVRETEARIAWLTEIRDLLAETAI